MDRRVRTNPFVSEQEDPEPTSDDGLPLESPSDGNDSKLAAGPAPKKRRGVQKRVVSVPIGDVDGPKSKGEAYPPSDSWAWRKYGQKPIKGSPYPRGYYRCSSSKGCPARKQVERSRVDPTKLVITYAFDHNHQLPAAKSHHHHHHHHSSPSPAAITAASAAADDSSPGSTTTSSSTSSGDHTNMTPTSPSPAAKFEEAAAVFASQPELELGGDSLLIKPCLGDFGWLADVAYDRILEGPICGGGDIFDDADVMVLSTRVDDVDESLFADLGELPEGSVIFGRRAVHTDGPNRTRGRVLNC
ncbi:probable WRKY transcription factor 69 isoform X2 [Momordica charantia]|uniref:Probable WRKY transcription factor 69 isoform X2 n=1 Tax=Momordica charantia TaxID=3673 RepID=A0A6J1D1E0_MOMCH|nr:probable WRKY transcription factor 69 isoform X2 [Momordica charantia]